MVRHELPLSGCSSGRLRLPAGKVLVIGDMFQPMHRLAVKRLLDRNVGHGGRGRSPVPMLVIGRTPDDISSANLDYVDAERS